MIPYGPGIFNIMYE
jgi:hypothetical protein